MKTTPEVIPLKRGIVILFGLFFLLTFISLLFLHPAAPLALSTEEIAELREKYPIQNKVDPFATFETPSLAEAAQEHGLLYVETIRYHHLGTYGARVIADSKNRIAPGEEIDLKLKLFGFLPSLEVGTQILVPAVENRHGIWEAHSFLLHYVTEDGYILSVRTDLYSDPTYNGYPLQSVWEELT